MRQALRRNVARRQTAISATVPAPVGGWDTESPLAAMPAKNAVILDNWIPRGGWVELRRGSKQHVTGTDAPVETLATWAGSSNGDKLLACAGADIFDVTDAGALNSAIYTASGSTTSARWNWVNFSNDAGRYVVMANGVHGPVKYDGSSVSSASVSGSSGSITLDQTDLKHVMAHKARIHYGEKDRLRVWYLAVNAIQGGASLLDLGPFFTKGGSLAGMSTWSMDGGAGPDDMAVYVTTEGQAAIYRGSDPGDANSWALVGVFNLPKPIGDRCMVQYGSDLAILTEDGVIPLSVVLSAPIEEQKSKSLSAKVASAFSDAAISYGGLFGWQPIFYPNRGSLLIVNVPTAEGVSAHQYVRSMQKGGWCRFTGLNAICWGAANGAIYFGGADGVYQWDTGASDDGATIVGDVKPAFNDFGSHLVEKHFTMIRPLIKAPSIIKPALEVCTDYKERVPVARQTVIQAGDIGPNDADEIRYAWTGVTATGYVATPRMRVEVLGNPETASIAIDPTLADLLLYEAGGGHVLTRPNLPLDVSVQLVGFDLVYQRGGVL